MTFTRLRSRPWKSGRALDVANLPEMDRVVLRLQPPPLREVEIAQTEMLEHQRARIDRRPCGCYPTERLPPLYATRRRCTIH